MTDCICEGNWRKIVAESEHLLGKQFKCDYDGETYTFYGIVWGDDDFYYGMYNKKRSQLLSCVGNLDGHGYHLIEEIE